MALSILSCVALCIWGVYKMLYSANIGESKPAPAVLAGVIGGAVVIGTIPGVVIGFGLYQLIVFLSKGSQ